MEWGLTECHILCKADSACMLLLGGLGICPQGKFALLRLNLEAVLTENYEAANLIVGG